MLCVRTVLRIVRKNGRKILLNLFCLSYYQENIVSLHLVERMCLAV